MDKNIYIVGAGTYGEAMFELATILGYNVICFYDDNVDKISQYVMGKKIASSFSSLKEADIADKYFIVAIGNNKKRYEICSIINDLGGITPSLIHPRALLSPSAKIGKGVYIQANAYIWTKVEIDDFCIISPNVVIAHHAHIGKACLISTGSIVGASVNINNSSFLGIGCSIITGVSEIGENSIIGAGALVLKDVQPDCVVVGSPARFLRKNT